MWDTGSANKPTRATHYREDKTMRRLTTFNVWKKGLMAKACATALLLGLPLATAAVHAAKPLFSIVVHFQYSDGFEFDYVLERGVPASEVGAALAECGRSHSTGSVVQYHCYPIPE
jgi:hypothetical protein